jgi:hypothetical protein
MQSIDGEISRLENVKALLTDHTVPLKPGGPAGKGKDGRSAKDEMGEG